MGADMIVIEDNGEHEIIDATGFVTRIVNGYTLLDVLGEGGQVTAYSAEKDGRKFCVREMEFGKNRPVNRHSNRKENENGPFKLVDLIEREARVLMELEHPKIPKVHDIFEHLEEGTLYFYMVQDLILGDNLKNIVERQGHFNDDEIINIMLQLTDVLKYLHNQNIPVIHRDIKPSNIMLDRKKSGDEVYLIDFGIVQQKLADETKGSTRFGSLGYSAPELLFSGIAYPQSDLYSLGATILFLKFGIELDGLMGTLQLDYKSKVKFDNSSIEVLVDMLTEQKPEDRPQTAEEVADYLQNIKDGKVLTRIAEKPNWINRLIARIVGKRTLRYLIGTRKEEVDKARRKVDVVNIEPNAEPIKLPDVNSESSVDFRGQNVLYIKMPTARYGTALKNLRRACEEDKDSRQPLLDGIPRPLTLKESFIARIMQPELWNVYLDTIVGIAYSAEDKNKFKINPICRELAGLSESFDGSYLPINYTGFNGVELDKREALYNKLLSREQFLAPHPAWYAALEGDIDLMRAIADHVYTESRRSVLRFYLYDNPQEDQLRHLFVNDSDYSGAVGSYNLYNDCRFLRVTPN